LGKSTCSIYIQGKVTLASGQAVPMYNAAEKSGGADLVQLTFNALSSDETVITGSYGHYYTIGSDAVLSSNYTSKIDDLVINKASISPSINPSITLPPNTVSVLNSATGLSCDQNCTNRALTCINAGTDPNGTNNRFVIYSGGACTIAYSMVNKCSYTLANNSSHSCNDADGNGSDKSYHPADWTYCQCGLSGTVSGVCLLADANTSSPPFSAPDIGTGYAKMAKPGVNTITELQNSCSQNDYGTLLAQYCRNNSNPVQQLVQTYTSSGSPSSKGCGANGCAFISCPSPACPNGDLGNLSCDTSGLIDETDLTMLLSQWAPNGPAPAPASGKHTADIVVDNKVNESDLTKLLSNWRTN
jgi:hypothetical protein